MDSRTSIVSDGVTLVNPGVLRSFDHRRLRSVDPGVTGSLDTGIHARLDPGIPGSVVPGVPVSASGLLALLALVGCRSSRGRGLDGGTLVLMRGGVGHWMEVSLERRFEI